jgi:type I restriction-modification system DNA methylase subunit
MPRPKSSKSSASLGFEAKLWLTADKRRNNLDAAEYKHVILGLIFLKHIAGNREEHRAKLIKGEGDYAGANPGARRARATRFTRPKGKNGGQFYTPSCVARCQSALAAPRS